MPSQIDTLDEQILAELQANGRLTMKALAERVGLSSPAMIERVRRLEERGVVSGYRAVVSPGALGRPLTALVAAQVTPKDQEAFLARVQADQSVVECHRTTGEANFLVKAHVPDTAALEKLVDALSVEDVRCTASLVLSSPVPWRSITPPEGIAGQRARPTRRRRRTAAAAPPPAGDQPAPRRPGRPPGRRKSTAG